MEFVKFFYLLFFFGLKKFFEIQISFKYNEKIGQVFYCNFL